MKKIIITLILLTTILAACSKNEAESSTTKMDQKPESSNTGAQITSPNLK